MSHKSEIKKKKSKKEYQSHVKTIIYRVINTKKLLVFYFVFQPALWVSTDIFYNEVWSMKYKNHLDIFTSTTKTFVSSVWKHSWCSIFLWLSSFYCPCGLGPVRDVWQRSELFHSQREQDKNNSPLTETIMIRCIQALDVSGVSRTELFQSYLQLYENMKAHSHFSVLCLVLLAVRDWAPQGEEMPWRSLHMWRKRLCQSCLGMLLTSAQ